MPTNFDLAPPTKTVDGLLAVPIDISSIHASFVFDGAAQTATADATITYEVGPTAGNPIFDLRQTITHAWLDGAVFAPAKLAHHAFGTGSFTDLRVVEVVQSAHSVHTLRVLYDVAVPNAQLGGSYLPALDWQPGPRLRFVFGLSDLNRARYAEAWLPANLPFDQFGIDLTLRIVNTLAAHEVITNAAVTVLGANHWSLSFPARFTTLSPMLEVRAADTLVRQTGVTVLPVSGQSVTIEAWKPATSSLDLGPQITSVAAFLSANENNYGSYMHGNRFVVFFNGSGGMEYDGGATTSTGALRHEVFHSWFARGLKPASQADGWWDEGYTSFHDDGADDTQPFDFGVPPVLLCSRDPWQRHTPSNSYSDGSRFWRGMASLYGVAQLNGWLAELYATHRGRPLSTTSIEEFLLRRSGIASTVDAFHRFVYGLADPTGSPDLWLRDDPAHGGDDHWAGAFWNSPDLWIRTQDDGGLAHQSPEYGQDNWFHARVRNRSASGTARHFVVTFHARGFAGTQFTFPADFLPCVAARAEFDLAPGATRVVRARWPRALVPPAGSHSCLLASVLTRGDHPIAGRHVWEHNNLAQKNLTVVDLVPGEFFILPVVIAHRLGRFGPRFDLELWRRDTGAELALSLLHREQAFFRLARARSLQRFQPEFRPGPSTARPVQLECGARLGAAAPDDGDRLLGSAAPERVARAFGDAWRLPLDPEPVRAVPIELPVGQQVVGLLVQAGSATQPGAIHEFHLVQRDRKTRRIVGGVALQVCSGKGEGHTHAK
jgi:hypothetical protein